RTGPATGNRGLEAGGGVESPDMTGDPGDHEASPLEGRDDREDQDRDVEEGDDHHPDGVEAGQGRSHHADERSDQSDRRDRAEEGLAVERVPADLAIAGRAQSGETEDREIPEDEERRTRRGGALGVHAAEDINGVGASSS